MRGMVVTFAARRMETAFVDHAVVKFRRGPSSRIHTTFPAAALFVSRNESSAKPVGSKVSRRQYATRSSANTDSGLAPSLTVTL
jgi:hypothetical protein